MPPAAKPRKPKRPLADLIAVASGKPAPAWLESAANDNPEVRAELDRLRAGGEKRGPAEVLALIQLLVGILQRLGIL